VYLVGSDRISTELHTINRGANAALPKPLTLDYEFNDPNDPQSLYTRSDHYSYAAKGIPIIFFTTGLHGDYHANTDEVSRIEFDKLARITQLIYETGPDYWRPPRTDVMRCVLKPSQCIRPTYRACSTFMHRSITTARPPASAMPAPCSLMTEY